ncbi:RagB/SusD family nutrient uptake outer membrane protein [Hymenobacter sp. HMF4947]|uniref:RagB/SusD family nutrient uptake outer membrane protein n=1 Tax=Hymenobacter ginkgonis TaxID=2682976 RepID=A0A7K1TGM4_9BACT|nr:RagB/SusD family nutrient uptake outer membrane protein [Hymenobacter ginkgonis]MVN77529.1 RagB/SusD family nutrient uptake outer membrane protein [Hymenobacter ginkgonis]
MQFHKRTVVALFGALALSTSCQKDLLDKVNPNQPTVENFWKTASDAQAGVAAAYSALQFPGTYARWVHFANDIRSDEGYSLSPWTDLANSTRFVQLDYDLEPVRVMWEDHYRGVYRCNQILANVPTIQMDATLQKTLLAEAHFLRGVYYFNLVTYFGNVPLILDPSTVRSTAPQGTIATGMAQVVSDLQAAIADLPVSNSVGHATKGSAQGLLGRVYMQQHKWSDASALFTAIISSGKYALVANYLDNFTIANENNSESVFEVQFSSVNQGGVQDVAGASEGFERAQFFGPPGIGWTDGRARPWLLDEMSDKTTTGDVDPRRDITVFHYPMLLFGQTYEARKVPTTDTFWHKYEDDRIQNFENYFSGINFRLIRYADILLMQAEAQNELGNTAAALPLINQVRSRPSVNITPLTGSFSQAQMRTQIMHERVCELAGEGTRWLDLNRWGLLSTQASLDVLKAPNHDPDFINFVIGKSELYPITRTDLTADPNLKQNPGY